MTPTALQTAVRAVGRFYKVVIVMLIEFLVGGIVSICNITIHALVMTLVVRVARASGTKKEAIRRCV